MSEDSDAEFYAGKWRVIVEETVGFGRDNQRWEITQVQPCANLVEARESAAILAESYQPEHPLSPRNRTVYQIGADTWLVRVTGMSRTYHFRISAGRLVGGSDT